MLHYRPRDEEGAPARLGLVVGKKLLKRAVHRNLLKRLVREQFRLVRSGLPACDLVVRLVAKPVNMDRKAIAAEIAGLFAKLAHRIPRPKVIDR
ncbi:MAG: ribonuclease protein component [Rhodocyclaceae bacterium]|nr:ribonuclease protein component [Rhodocyclaceae bacterium]